MVSADHAEPPDIVDRLLWRDAQTMLGRHAAPDHDGGCVWCGSPWPCPPRRLAERADEVSRRPWYDLDRVRALPSGRSEQVSRHAAFH